MWKYLKYHYEGEHKMEAESHASSGLQPSKDVVYEGVVVKCYVRKFAICFIVCFEEALEMGQSSRTAVMHSVFECSLRWMQLPNTDTANLNESSYQKYDLYTQPTLGMQMNGGLDYSALEKSLPPPNICRQTTNSRS